MRVDVLHQLEHIDAPTQRPELAEPALRGVPRVQHRSLRTGRAASTGRCAVPARGRPSLECGDRPSCPRRHAGPAYRTVFMDRRPDGDPATAGAARQTAPSSQGRTRESRAHMRPRIRVALSRPWAPHSTTGTSCSRRCRGSSASSRSSRRCRPSSPHPMLSFAERDSSDLGISYDVAGSSPPCCYQTTWVGVIDFVGVGRTQTMLSTPRRHDPSPARHRRCGTLRAGCSCRDAASSGPCRTRTCSSSISRRQGFTVLRPQDLSFRTQVALFNGLRPRRRIRRRSREHDLHERGLSHRRHHAPGAWRTRHFAISPTCSG